MVIYNISYNTAEWNGLRRAVRQVNEYFPNGVAAYLFLDNQNDYVRVVELPLEMVRKFLEESLPYKQIATRQ